MSVVANQHARDAAIYRAWIDGRRMVDLAEQYGVTHSAISQAVARHQAALRPLSAVRRSAGPPTSATT